MPIPICQALRGRSAVHRYIETCDINKLKEELRALTPADVKVIFSSSHDPGIPHAVYVAALWLMAKHAFSLRSTLRYYRELSDPSHFNWRQLEFWILSPGDKKLIRSPKFFQNKFGEHWKGYYEVARRRSNPYNVESVSRRLNVTPEAAARIVRRRKAATAGNYATFVKRAGGDVAEARRKFNQFRRRSAHTEEKFREKYGRGYPDKWEAYKRSKNSYDLEKYVAKYGERLGREKLLDRIDRSVVDFFKYVEIYGEQNAEREYVRYCYRKTLSWKRRSGRWGATKESLDFFKPLLNWMDRNEVGYRIGVEGNRELALLDRDTGKVRLYDLYVPKAKLVVEFDGFTHPSPFLSRKELRRWRCKMSGVSARTRLEDDESKRRTAVRRGMKFIRVHVEEVKRDVQGHQRSLMATIKSLTRGR